MLKVSFKMLGETNEAVTSGSPLTRDALKPL